MQFSKWQNWPKKPCKYCTKIKPVVVVAEGFNNIATNYNDSRMLTVPQNTLEVILVLILLNENACLQVPTVVNVFEKRGVEN